MEDDDPPVKEWRIQQEELDRIFKEALCIQCGCCVSECNSMEVDPDFIGPAALAKAARFVGDVRDRGRKERLRTLNGPHGVWDCTRCYFCNQRCPKGVDPRDAIAKLGAEIYSEGMLSDGGARHAQVFDVSSRMTGYLLETALVPYSSPKQAMDIKFAMQMAKSGKVPNPLQAPPREEARRGPQAAQAVAADGRGRARRQATGSHHRQRAGVVNSSYAYYPGCLASLSQKELDTSTRAVSAKLGFSLIDIPGFTCCGAGDIHEARPEYYLHLNARILGQAEQLEQKTLLTICNVCTLNLRQADIKLKADPDLRERINKNLREVGAATYNGTVEVRHLLWEIAEGEGYERLKEIAQRPLEGVKIAPFYGCQILRPSKLLGFEDPDRPQSLERIIEACGAIPVDYPSKIKCCGFPIVLAREEVALGELIQPLAEAKAAGADAMVTPCPLCHLSLDAWQGKASKEADIQFDMPIFHLAQLVGAAAGLSYDELQFKRHITKAHPATDKIYAAQ